eukprot:363169-Chlamydomonas_euryale.AAC.25
MAQRVQRSKQQRQQQRLNQLCRAFSCAWAESVAQDKTACGCSTCGDVRAEAASPPTKRRGMLFIGVVLARGVDTAAGAAAAVLAYFLQNASSCVSADSTVPEGTKAARARKLPRYAAAMQRAMSGTPVVDVARDSSSAISDSERHGGPSAAEPNTKNWVNLQRAVGSTRRSNNDSRHAHTSDALPANRQRH